MNERETDRPSGTDGRRGLALNATKITNGIAVPYAVCVVGARTPHEYHQTKYYILNEISTNASMRDFLAFVRISTNFDY